MWRDWVNIVLGFWLAVSPWLIGGAVHSENLAMVWNCVLTGSGIAALAGWAAAPPREVWPEWAVVLLGVWLLIAPNTLDYDIPVVTWNNIAVGLAAGILAIWRIFKVDIQDTTTGPK